MPIEIRMPEVAADVSEADVLAWLVEPGDLISKGDVILEIETDKSTVEIEAPSSGVLAEIHVAAGTQNVPIGALLGLITADEAADATSPEARSAAEMAPDTAPPAAGGVGAPALSSATALARRLADQAGVDLTSLQGSGVRGRIKKVDVERTLGASAKSVPGQDVGARSKTAQAEVALPSRAEDSRDTELPHTRMRRTIARRLGASKQTVPHFYLRARCNMDELLATRAQLNEQQSEVRISLNDFVIRAAALALREVPTANASWGEDAIQMHSSVDISVAVATDGGLITPVLREADRKGLAALSTEMRELAGRAREGKLAPREYQGGGFSISNLGMYGIDSVYPIINAPEACILGVGAATRLPVVRGDEIGIGTQLILTLSADHRVVDGAVGAQLLSAVKRRLEHPLDMVL